MINKYRLRFIVNIIIIVIVLVFTIPSLAYAARGDLGYEGGISSGSISGASDLEYQELCFLSGKPFIFIGELKIRTISRQGSVKSTYTYNLENASLDASLKRTVIYETIVTEKGNGQTIENTIVIGNPSEVIRIGNKVYTLRKYEMSKSDVIDKKPAISYVAGNLWGKKTYRVGNLNNEGNVTVESIGEIYGYDQIWSAAESGTINYTIQSEEVKDGEVDSWGGTGKVTFSQTTTKLMKYIVNEPDQISFDGGYIEERHSNSILEYELKIPEFDSFGASTDRIISLKDTLKMESFPVQERLPVPQLNHLRGHWAENDIKTLFSLEIIRDEPTRFNPSQFINRQEFTAAVVNATREAVEEETVKTGIFSRFSKKEEEEVESPFVDVSPENPNFKDISYAYESGIINGKESGVFAPDDYVMVADAITIFIRAIGLERLAPNPGAVTAFKDNDSIPSYARDAIYAAQRIGLVKGDDKGYVNANEYLTKDRAAALLNRFIDYMRTGIQKDYRERMFNY